MKKINSVLLVLALIIGLIPGVANAKLVACVGDSITYGFGLPNPESNSYPARLERILRQFDPDWQTQNFGHSGATLLRNKSASYVTKTAYSLALASEPDLVIIELGSNDSARATRSELEHNFIPDYLALIDDFAQLPSQPRIFVCYPPPIYPNSFGYNDTVITDVIIPLIEQLPTYRAVEIIDLYTLLEDSAHLFPDGLHPNTEGARMMAELIAETILGFRGHPDLNGDEMVNFKDFCMLAQYWRRDQSPFASHDVDHRDLAFLAEYWLREMPPVSLIAYWRLDETEGAIACNSVGDKDGTLYGEPLWQPDGGIVGGALQFDGIDDYVSSDFVLNPGVGSFSVFAWIKGGAPGQVVISQMGGANCLCADPSQGKLMTELRPPVGRVEPPPLVSECVITDGLWHRIGFVWDGSNRTLYVDGVEVATDTQTRLAGSGHGLYIGAGKDLDAGSFWSGLIDDVRIYDVALSAAEIHSRQVRSVTTGGEQTERQDSRLAIRIR